MSVPGPSVGIKANYIPEAGLDKADLDSTPFLAQWDTQVAGHTWVLPEQDKMEQVAE